MTVYDKFRQPNFEEEIENIVYQEDLDYLDAILFFCEKNQIEDTSIVSKFISQSLMKKLTDEATEKKLIKKQYRSKTESIENLL